MSSAERAPRPDALADPPQTVSLTALRPYPWEQPLGARPVSESSACFRVWAPEAREVLVRLPDGDHRLSDAGYGVREAVLEAQPGTDYWFVLDGAAYPDPCSRWQPDGLRGPSRVLEALRPPAAGAGARTRPGELVIYELNIGTFTAEGTFAAACERLGELASFGVTAIELLPVAEFPGKRGWGYDGVYISATQSSYGGPHGLLALVERAHLEGLAVILDVVYNHLGASGEQALRAFGPYFTTRYQTPWGDAINYDDADCDPVREWVLQSATGWIEDFGIDGLRLDATHAIFDQSAEHIVAAIARRVHAVRPDALVIAENGLNDPRVVRDAKQGGFGCDGVWADDFHHALWACLTGERDGYYADFGRLDQLAKALVRPFVYTGEYSEFRRHRFGAPALDVPTARFVVFSQNHDQVGNRALGDRTPARARALAAFCTLLSGFVPLLFMGEEYGEDSPFLFYADHIDKEIADATREGRRREFANFEGFSEGEEVPDPMAVETFERSKLTRARDERLAELYANLLHVRREVTGEVTMVAFDQTQGWLRATRGDSQLAMNFGAGTTRVPLEPASGALELVLGTDPAVALDGATVSLPPLSGALVR